MTIPSSKSPQDGGDFDSSLHAGNELQSVQPAIGLPRNIAFSRGTVSHNDLTSDAGHVAQALNQAQGKGMIGGIAALMRLRYETWLEERMKDPVLRKLEVRKEVAHAQKQAEDAQNALSGSLHDRSRSGHLQQIELNRLNRERLLSDLAQYALPSTEESATVTPMHISKEQLESLALRAAMRLEQEPGDQAAMWSEYKAELYGKMPQNVAQEIERRILELRSLIK